MTAVEDTLRPTTVNEVLLLDRIRELHIERYTNPGRAMYQMSGSELSVSPTMQELRLPLIAEVDCKTSILGGLEITCRTRSSGEYGQLGYRHFVSQELMEKATPTYSANILGRIHERVIRELAKSVSKR